MLHELDFAHVEGLFEGYERAAAVSGAQACELDLDRLRLTFVTRFPLTEAARRALQETPGLVSVRCSPSSARVFPVTEVVAL